MKNCQHPHMQQLQLRGRFSVEQCTRCRRVFALVTTQYPPVRLETIIREYATGAPQHGYAYYWQWEGLWHSTTPLPHLSSRASLPRFGLRPQCEHTNVRISVTRLAETEQALFVKQGFLRETMELAPPPALTLYRVYCADCEGTQTFSKPAGQFDPVPDWLQTYLQDAEDWNYARAQSVPALEVS